MRAAFLFPLNCQLAPEHRWTPVNLAFQNFDFETLNLKPAKLLRAISSPCIATTRYDTLPF